MKIRKFLPLLLGLVALTISAASPKYIFYFIGDGMGPGQTMTADNYNRLVLKNDTPITMMTLPVSSFATTYSASSPVTDSAAAGTALSTGSKTRNGMLGMNADSIPVTSIAKIFHDNGYGVAIITTVDADDATPGAFYAHVPNRGMSHEIDRMAAEADYEIIGGRALRALDKPDVLPYFAENNVEVVYGVDAMRNSDSRKLMVLAAPDPEFGFRTEYAVDDYRGAIDLEEFLDASIDHLMKYTPKKFFIMAEGGSIDHASHGNDGGTAIKETLAFNRAIDRAIEFYNKHPKETLIIITADHETGGMAVGNRHTGYAFYPEYLAPQKVSKDVFSQYCDKIKRENTPITWPEMKQILTDQLGFFTVVPISESEEKHLETAFRKFFIDGDDERFQSLYANVGSFPQEVFEMLNKIAGVGWTAGSHSGNFVPVFAIGAGAELFMGNNDNTDIPKKILKSSGVKH